MPRSLAGQTVLVAASEERTEAIARRLRSEGANVVPFPTVRIDAAPNLRKLDDALRKWRSYDWVVFTSTNGVRAAIARAGALRLGLGTRPPRIAAVGPATKALAEAEGLSVDAMPAEFLTDAIAPTLGSVAGSRVLLVRSSLGRKSLAERLRADGAHVDEVSAYEARLSAPDVSRLPAASGIDLVVFTSGSTVQNLVALLPPPYLGVLRDRAVAVCIGPVTADVARASGFRVSIVAREHTVPGLLRALQEVPAIG